MQKMKKLIPNPDYQKAELQLGYFTGKGSIALPGLAPLRFWAKDRRKLNELMLADKWDEVEKLSVPPHIEVEEAQASKPRE
jgi:hypothetical protein